MAFWDELRERNVARLVELWEEVRDRRLFQIVGTYIGAGWLVLEGADMLVGRDLLSELAYRLTLVGYLSGIPASAIIGWYHGEKGEQRLTLPEIGLLCLVGAGAITIGGVVVNEYETSPETLSARSTLDLRRVAVLPFDALDASTELRTVAEGLTESLIGRLQQVNQLEVISENGVRPYRGTGVPPDSVARALEVGTVITGAVSGGPEEMRITTRLVDGESGAVVNEDVLTTSRDELLTARDSVSTVLSRYLRRWIGEELTARTERVETENTEAWVLLQRGENQLQNARNAASHGRGDTAMALFSEADSAFAAAERADPDWADPVVGRARVAYRKGRTLLQVAGDRHGAVQALNTGLKHVERALKLNSGHAKAREMRGTSRYTKYHVAGISDPDRRHALLEAARKDLEAAVDTDPTLASAYSTLSHLYYQPPVRDLVNVALAARRAYEADAYLEEADAVLWRLFQAQLDLGQFRQARRWCEEGRDRFPGEYRFRLCRLRLMTTPELEPNVDEAWRLADAVDSLATAGGRPVRQIELEAEMRVAAVLARADFTDSARAVLTRARSEVTPEIDPRDFLLGVEAYVHVLLEDENRALALLRRYVSAHPSHDFRTAGEVSWRWSRLQDHPEFQSIRQTH